jgi:hypothetical protein
MNVAPSVEGVKPREAVAGHEKMPARRGAGPAFVGLGDLVVGVRGGFARGVQAKPSLPRRSLIGLCSDVLGEDADGCCDEPPLWSRCVVRRAHEGVEILDASCQSVDSVHDDRVEMARAGRGERRKPGRSNADEPESM